MLSIFRFADLWRGVIDDVSWPRLHGGSSVMENGFGERFYLSSAPRELRLFFSEIGTKSIIVTAYAPLT
jgi:hypothetical protein